MAEPFLSEIRIMSFGFPPKGWALCDGQLLPINQNQGLFSLLGTTYGGDGRVNFGLPNLQGRVPIHMGSGHTLGERGGRLKSGGADHCGDGRRKALGPGHLTLLLDGRSLRGAGKLAVTPRLIARRR